MKKSKILMFLPSFCVTFVFLVLIVVIFTVVFNRFTINFQSGILLTIKECLYYALIAFCVFYGIYVAVSSPITWFDESGMFISVFKEKSIISVAWNSIEKVELRQLFSLGGESTVLLVYNEEHYIIPSALNDMKKWNSSYAVGIPIDLRRFRKQLNKYRPDLRIEHIKLSYFHD